MNSGKLGKTPTPITYERRRATDEPARSRARATRDSNWLENSHKPGSRHAAITRTLYNWSSYKSWADKVRNSWDREK